MEYKFLKNIRLPYVKIFNITWALCVNVVSKNISHIYLTITHKHSIKLFHRAVILTFCCFAYAPGFSEIFSIFWVFSFFPHIKNFQPTILKKVLEKHNVFRVRPENIVFFPLRGSKKVPHIKKWPPKSGKNLREKISENPGA